MVSRVIGLGAGMLMANVYVVAHLELLRLGDAAAGVGNRIRM